MLRLKKRAKSYNEMLVIDICLLSGQNLLFLHSIYNICTCYHRMHQFPFVPVNSLVGIFFSMQGLLSDGTIIAVKQLSSKSKQGNREFVNEIGMISALQHPNLVKLHGCCVEGNQLMLVYEYMENNCLSRALFGEINYLYLFTMCITVEQKNLLQAL